MSNCYAGFFLCLCGFKSWSSLSFIQKFLTDGLVHPYESKNSFLSWHMIQCKEACERLVLESIKSSNQLYIRGGGLKKKNFFLNQIYFEIGMFIYIVSSRVHNCVYLWNAPLVKIYVSGLVHFPRSVCLFSVNALILRCTVAEVFDVILHSLSLLKWQIKLMTSRQNVNTQTINSTFMFTQHIKRLIQMAMSEWYI